MLTADFLTVARYPLQTDTMNWIDFIAIVPYYIELVFNLLEVSPLQQRSRAVCNTCGPSRNIRHGLKRRVCAPQVKGSGIANLRVIRVCDPRPRTFQQCCLRRTMSHCGHELVRLSRATRPLKLIETSVARPFIPARPHI